MLSLAIVNLPPTNPYLIDILYAKYIVLLLGLCVELQTRRMVLRGLEDVEDVEGPDSQMKVPYSNDQQFEENHWTFQNGTDSPVAGIL